MKVAVVAHSKKRLAGHDVNDLMDAFESLGCVREGWSTPRLFETAKSKQVPKAIRNAIDEGAELIYVWGGDGSVQQAVDTIAGTGVSLAILPAGTANSLARALGIPIDLEAAIAIGAGTTRRTLDVGTVNGEHFVVMAGAGFDASLMRDTSASDKAKLGKLAYIRSARQHLSDKLVQTTIKVDGEQWFRGRVSCVLVGNVGRVMGGGVAFAHAEPDDGRLEVGIVSARNAWDWGKVAARMATGHPERSRLVETTAARRIKIRFDTPVLYELDGGVRTATDRLDIRVVPAALTVSVPSPTSA